MTPAFERLQALIEQESDVFHIHALTERLDGSFVYLIQTPFATFPKYVVGITDAENTSPIIHLCCGALWSAESAFQDLIQP